MCYLAGVKDASTVSPDLPLVDLGLDSIMGIEIKQTLERDHDISMSAKDIRALTFAQLDQLSTSTPKSADDAADVSPPASETVTPATGSSIRYDFPTEAVVEMNDVDKEAAPLFVIVIDPAEESVVPLSFVMSKISTAKVYGFQCTTGTPLLSIPDLASQYIKVSALFAFLCYHIKLFYLSAVTLLVCHQKLHVTTHVIVCMCIIYIY